MFAWATSGPTWAIDPIFGERWETATIRSYAPTEDTVFLEADAGTWWLGDTVANFPECGETPHRATISMINGSKALTLVSENSNSGCADNIWVTFQELGPYNPGFAIPVTSDTLISFDATGDLVNPKSGPDTCVVLPCGDEISLTLQVLPSGSQLSYILQRAPDAVPNTRHAFYREIFLDPDTGSYQRNLMNDLMSIPNFNPSGAQVKLIEFAVDEHGSATLDNLIIETGQLAPVSINSFTATPASIQEGETTTLNWTVSNATSCTALNGTSDWQAVTPSIAGGTANISLSTVGSFTFTLQCTDGTTTVSSDAEVNVHQLQLTEMNVGLNDAWYYPITNGQGFFITVFPDIGSVSLAWFTYDTVRPAEGTTANLGEPSHRWLNALGAYSGNQSVMNISITSGGIFDTSTEVTTVSDGTIILTFTDCENGTVEYDIPSISQKGTVPIQRVVGDNIALCESMSEQAAVQQISSKQKTDDTYILLSDNPASTVEASPLVNMNAGLNDAWYYPITNGQGFFITVFPDIGSVSLAWFTYDTVRPAEGTTANLGEPSHRWLNALGAYSGNQSVMNISITSGGIFDTSTEVTTVSDGTIILTFTDCENGTVEYDIPSISQKGTVPIQRVVGDNIALCEALNTVRRRLNDTGIDWGRNYPDGNNTTCTGETIAAQDCSHGRDVTHKDDSDGHAGFSFTKLDANGNALPASASTWSCVRDEVTGLTWEAKTDDGGLQDTDNTYSWYNPDPDSNGGNPGTWNDGVCTGSDCDTYGYVQAVNAGAQALCGARDWRMPWPQELRSIVDYSRYDPAIDTVYFPLQRSLAVWSGSPYAGTSKGAWYVGFLSGGDFNRRYRNYQVRLVRGGQ